jgi:hydroxyethylthiazole kinase
MFEGILKNVRQKAPIVQNITNFVTVNDCANIILACGGSPTMSDDIREVAETAAICQSLVANMGVVDKVDSMIAASKKCNELGHPVILDPVAAGATTLRTQTAFQLLKEVRFSAIRGNISEIKTIYHGYGTTKGVDADAADAVTEENLDDNVLMAKKLSAKIGAVIVISGAIDIAADSQKAYIIRNGHPMMARITGSGCMSTALIGAFCGANPEHILDSCAAAMCAMGLCGELAYEKTMQTQGGTLSFRTYLIDAMSNLTPQMLSKGMKLEIS